MKKTTQEQAQDWNTFVKALRAAGFDAQEVPSEEETRAVAEKMDTMEGETFHATLEKMSSTQLRAFIALPDRCRWLACNWADEYLPEAVAREASKKGRQDAQDAQARRFLVRVENLLEKNWDAPYVDLADAVLEVAPKSREKCAAHARRIRALCSRDQEAASRFIEWRNVAGELEQLANDEWHGVDW